MMNLRLSSVAGLLALACPLVLMSGCGGGAPKEEAESEQLETATSDEEDMHNMLTEEEKTSGWTLLFDGKSLNGWHSFNRDAAVGWSVEDGVLTNNAEEAVDLVTDEQYGNFELMFEWKVPENGNSGLMYRVVESEEYEQPWNTGPEYQLLDDHSEELQKSLKPSQFAASNYDMQAPSKSVSNPTGEWNQARLVVNGNHVEHWLNGEKVVEYELGSDAWQKQVDNSKWKDYPDYGKASQGYLAFQGDHTKVWLRDIKIREL
jgi:hypothetical protein